MQEDAAPPTETPSGIWQRLSLWFERHRLKLLAPLTILLFGLVGAAIYRLTDEISYADVVRNLEATPITAILLALVFTAASFCVLTLYDWNALEYIGRRLPPLQIGLTAFSAYAVGNTVGFGALSGGAIRYRAYTRLGMPPDEIAKVIGFVTLSFGLGVVVVSALSVLAIAEEASMLLGIDTLALRIGASIVLAIVAGFVLLAETRKSLKIGPVTIRLADTKTLSRQFIITVVDLAASASVIYVLLPDSATISWPAFFAVYSVATGLAVISHVPAGIGVFETIIIAALGNSASVDAILGSLVLYRLIYYVLPLVAAMLFVSFGELRRLAGRPMSRDIARFTGRMATPLIATLAFMLGVMLIFSSVTPTPSDNLEFLSAWLPLPVVEGAHFIASLLGLLLVVSARGLSQRLDGAWWTALFAACAGLLLSLLKAAALLEAILLGFLIISLLASRRRFNRPASLLRQALTTSWLTAIAVICLCAVFILLFVYRNIDYSHELWWQFEFTAEAPRSLRAVLGLLIAAFAISAFSLLRPAIQQPDPPSAEDLAAAVAIMEKQSVADANLVRMGDKSLMFSPTRDAFIMYGRQGRSWIAFLDPIGEPKSHGELVWEFVEAARACGCRAVFYQASPALLPAIADAGLQAFKLGESADVDLHGFDLKGGRWATLRQTATRAERDGLTFEIIETADLEPVLDELKAVSDGWLAEHRTREKGFSLGAFTDAYMLSQPVAILRFEGRIVAFANILQTGTNKEASIDLMRFAPEAPKGAMDFLFVSLMKVMRERGVIHFNLGMAPLAGLSRREIAPVWDRLANTFYEHGERYYNFKGLRAFKSKFHPHWQPRYLAVSGGLNPILALFDATLLIGGGLKGVVLK